MLMVIEYADRVVAFGLEEVLGAGTLGRAR
jgi:hypothetical protein